MNETISRVLESISNYKQSDNTVKEKWTIKKDFVPSQNREKLLRQNRFAAYRDAHYRFYRPRKVPQFRYYGNDEEYASDLSRALNRFLSNENYHEIKCMTHTDRAEENEVIIAALECAIDYVKDGYHPVDLGKGASISDQNIVNAIASVLKKMDFRRAACAIISYFPHRISLFQNTTPRMECLLGELRSIELVDNRKFKRMNGTVVKSDSLQRKLICVLDHLDAYEKEVYVLGSFSENLVRSGGFDGLCYVNTYLSKSNLETALSKEIISLLIDFICAVGRKENIYLMIEKYSYYFSSNSLSNLLEKYLDNFETVPAKKIFAILRQYDASHPSIAKYADAIERLENIDCLRIQQAMDAEKINSLSGEEFENIVAKKFIDLGFDARTTQKSGDYGADIIVITPNDSKIVIQCKRFKAKVNLKSVQEVVGAIPHYSADYGIVITNSSFLKSAKTLAFSNDIELWDGNALIKFLLGDISFSGIGEL